MIYQAGQREQLLITRDEANFDRASDAAYELALMRFGSDDGGHLTNVIDSERSTDAVMVEFVYYRRSGGMSGQSHMYVFEAWVERSTEG